MGREEGKRGSQYVTVKSSFFRRDEEEQKGEGGGEGEGDSECGRNRSLNRWRLSGRNAPRGEDLHGGGGGLINTTRVG